MSSLEQRSTVTNVLENSGFEYLKIKIRSPKKKKKSKKKEYTRIKVNPRSVINTRAFSLK